MPAVYDFKSSANSVNRTLCFDQRIFVTAEVYS
jgi:hypothetical protein